MRLEEFRDRVEDSLNKQENVDVQLTRFNLPMTKLNALAATVLRKYAEVLDDPSKLSTLGLNANSSPAEIKKALLREAWIEIINAALDSDTTMDDAQKRKLSVDFLADLASASGRRLANWDQALDYLADQDLDIEVLYDHTNEELDKEADKIAAQQEVFKLFRQYCDDSGMAYAGDFYRSGILSSASVLDADSFKHGVSTPGGTSPDEIFRDFMDYVDHLYLILDNLRANQAIPNTKYWASFSKSFRSHVSKQQLASISSGLHYWKHGSFKKYYSTQVGKFIKTFADAAKDYGRTPTPAATADTINQLHSLSDGTNTITPADALTKNNVVTKLQNIKDHPYFTNFAPGWSVISEADGKIRVDNVVTNKRDRQELVETLISYSSGKLRPLQEEEDSILFEFIENSSVATDLGEKPAESTFGTIHTATFRKAARRDAAEEMATKIDSGSLNLDDPDQRREFFEAAADKYLDRLDEHLLQEVKHRKGLMRVRFNEGLNSIAAKAGKLIKWLKPKSKKLQGLGLAAGVGASIFLPGSVFSPGSLAFWAAYPYAATATRRFAPWIAGKARNAIFTPNVDAEEAFADSAKRIFEMDNVSKINSTDDFNKYFTGATNAHASSRENLKKSWTRSLEAMHLDGKDKIDYANSVLDFMDVSYTSVIDKLTPNRFGLGRGSTGIFSRTKALSASLMMLGAYGAWSSFSGGLDTLTGRAAAVGDIATPGTIFGEVKNNF